MSLIDRILRRRSYYRAVFETVPGRAVLADLRRFSRAGSSPLVTSMVRQQVDPIATAVRIGHQEMFARIVHHLNIDDAQLLNLKEEAEND